MICYAFVENNGEIDLDSISEFEEDAKDKALESVMGWRFLHPHRFSREEVWDRVKRLGSVRKISVTVVEAE